MADTTTSPEPNPRRRKRSSSSFSFTHCFGAATGSSDQNSNCFSCSRTRKFATKVVPKEVSTAQMENMESGAVSDRRMKIEGNRRVEIEGKNMGIDKSTELPQRTSDVVGRATMVEQKTKSLVTQNQKVKKVESGSSHTTRSSDFGFHQIGSGNSHKTRSAGKIETTSSGSSGKPSLMMRTTPSLLPSKSLDEEEKAAVGRKFEPRFWWWWLAAILVVLVILSYIWIIVLMGRRSVWYCYKSYDVSSDGSSNPQIRCLPHSQFLSRNPIGK